jgi:hypothetical protein
VSAIAIPLTLTESILPCVGDYNLSPPPHTQRTLSRPRQNAFSGRQSGLSVESALCREGGRERGRREGERGAAGRRQEGGREGHM